MMSTSSRSPILLILLLAVSLLWPDGASAQQPAMNRCAGPGGNTIYTDRPCESIGAIERLPRSAIASAYGLRRGGCARNLQDLIYEMTAAIDNRDVNRLGSVYHWVGQSAESGDRILDRLQAIVDRPLVDIVPLRGAAAPIVGAADTLPAPPSATTPSTAAASTAAPATLIAPEVKAADVTVPRPTVRRVPVGLRLEQTLGKSATPSRTVVGLRRHLDCWWITL
jgi:hypothetical protein